MQYPLAPEVIWQVADKVKLILAGHTFLKELHMKNEPQRNTVRGHQVRRYEAPAVRDLGPWKTLTLIYSVPVIPGTGIGSNNVQ